MEKTECPRCGEATITMFDRFKAGKWLDIYCSNCKGRMCANPIILAIMYFILCWDIFFFGFMAVYEKSWIYAAAMFIGWAILEFFILYVPLTKLRPVQQKNPNGS